MELTITPNFAQERALNQLRRNRTGRLHRCRVRQSWHAGNVLRALPDPHNPNRKPFCGVWVAG